MKRKRRVQGHRQAGRRHNRSRKAMAKQRLQKAESQAPKKVYGEPSLAGNLALTVAVTKLAEEQTTEGTEKTEV